MKWEFQVTVFIEDSLKVKLFEMIIMQGEKGNHMNKVELIEMVRFELQQRYPGMPIGLKEAKDLVDAVIRNLANFIHTRGSYNIS